MNDNLPAAKIDIAVLLLFFNRPDTFRLVFEEVRKARPSHLFLYQDGPRGERDMAGIRACREIAEQIDWQCEVHRKYQEKNYGCDPSEYIAQTWAFSIVDKCIVLEDDDVPSQSFFPFCKEMLDRYENDSRITMVAGFNPDEIVENCTDSYLFTSVFSIWGWASWRRVIETWDPNYSFLDDEQTCTRLENLIRQRKYRSDFMQMCRDHRASGKAYYESIFWANMLLNNGLAIMPTRNMINNVGATTDSTHYSGLKTMPSGLKRIFTMARHEIDFPLQHPKYVMEDVAFKERWYRIYGWGHPWVKIGRSLEELWLNARVGNWHEIGVAIKKRIGKWMGKSRHA